MNVTLDDITSDGPLTSMTNTTFSFIGGEHLNQFHVGFGGPSWGSGIYSNMIGLVAENARLFGDGGGVVKLGVLTNLQTRSIGNSSLNGRGNDPLRGGLAGHFHSLSGSSDFGHFSAGAPTGYIGFRLQAGGHTYNGWLRVGVSFNGAANPQSISLLPKLGSPNIYGAWSKVEEAAVPEPAQVATSLGLPALGAAGVREFRRRGGHAAIAPTD